MTQPTSTQHHSYLFKCVAIPIGWIVDEVWPVVKTGVTKTYHVAIDVFSASGQEYASYASSGLKESIKCVLFLGHCASETREFPRGTIREIFWELARYSGSGGCELLKGAVTVCQAGSETLALIIPDLIQPIAVESGSYLYSGAMQVIVYAGGCAYEGRDWARCAVYTVTPVAKEVLSYGETGAYEGAKAVMVLASNVHELFLFSAALKSILIELHSYIGSGESEMHRGAETTGKALREAKSAVKHMNQRITVELDDAFDSGLSEGKKLRFNALKEILAILKIYGRPVAQEAASYAATGVDELCKGVKTTALAIHEGAYPLRIGLSEAGSYLSSGRHEAAKGVFKVLPEAAHEISLLIGNVPANIMLELSSYARSGIAVQINALIECIAALQELSLVPKEACLTAIQELKSYLKSTRGELAKTDQLLRQDIPIALKHGIGDPITEATMEFVYEYRRWRAQRS